MKTSCSFVLFIVFLLVSVVYFEPTFQPIKAQQQFTTLFNDTSTWSMFRGNTARTGNLANATLISPTEWNYSIFSPVLSSPAISNGLVFIKGEHMLCVNASTGSKVWESSVNSNQQFSSPVVADGYIYACDDLQGTSGGEVYALNESTGEQVWSFKANSGTSTPAVDNGILYVGSDNGNVYAINAYTGKRIWNYSTEGPVNSSPAIANGLVYIGSDDGNVYAVNSSSGTKIWNYTTGIAVKHSIISSPAVGNGVVYIGSDNTGVFALNATSGAKIWNFPTESDTISTPAVSNDYVFTASSSYIYALNSSTGNEIWKFKISPAFAPNGDEASSPAIANGVVYFNCFDFNLYALDAATGDKIGNFTVIQPDIDFLARFSSPAVAANEKVYVGMDGTLYAINVASFTSLKTAPSTQLAYIIIILALVIAVVFGLLIYRKHRKT